MKSVADVMRPIGLMIDSYSTVAEAAKKMKELDIGALGVSSAGAVVALLTDRDIVHRAVAENRDLNLTKLDQIMSGAPIRCRIGDSLERAAELLSIHKIHRLLVTDESDKAVGILSLTDVVIEIVAEDSRIFFDILQNVKSCG